MNRRYRDALDHYNQVLVQEHPSASVRKRAIICCIQTRDIPRALALFVALIREDIASILGQDNERAGCPCPDIIQEYESRLTREPTEDDLIALGILWLYCVPLESGAWFLRALDRAPDNATLNTVIDILTQHHLISLNSISDHTHTKE